MQFILKAVLIAVALNIVLPLLLSKVATKNQIKPPNGAQNLPFLGQLMHMFVHHAQVPISSSVIIAVIVGISVYSAKNI